MNELLKAMNELQDKKTTHYFMCSQCMTAHVKIDVNDYCNDYKKLMRDEAVLHSLIDNYKIDID